MKKRFLFIGLLMSVMCMFSSCLLINVDRKTTNNNTYNRVHLRNQSPSVCEIARVYYRKSQGDSWKLCFTDGYDYEFADRSSYAYRWNEDVYFDLPESNRYYFKVLAIFTDEGSRNSYGTYAYYYSDGRINIDLDDDDPCFSFNDESVYWEEY